jgi:pimeloyl-ACP methyl ester carboxylesterase
MVSTGYAGHASQYKRESVRVGDLTVPYLKGGYGAPLLYLHGLGGWGQWERHVYALAVTNLVYMPQLPGWREGEAPEGISTVKDYARLMVDFLDALDIGQVVVAGHSIGGWVALYLATEHPERVSKLILVDVMGLDVPGAPMSDLAALDEDAFAQAAFASTGTVQITGDFGDLVESVRTGPEFERHWKGRDVVVALTKGQYADAELTKRLSEITAETLIIWGDNDHLVPQQHGDALAAAIPHARYVVIRGGGHMPMRLKPETFNRVVRDFLIGQTDDEEISDELVLVRR